AASRPGSTPTTRPPAPRAPALAAAMTPPRPPVSTTAPPRARPAPTASAAAASSGPQSPAPTTATCNRREGSMGRWYRTRPLSPGSDPAPPAAVTALRDVPDAELVRRIADRRQDALGALYDRYAGLLL